MKKKHLILPLVILALFIGSTPCIHAQEHPSDSTAVATDSSQVSILGLGIISGVTLGGFLYGHVLQSEIWWKGERSAFHFDWEHDWSYALGSDKFGHAYFPYLTTSVYAEAFSATGLDSSTSLQLACGLAFAYQTYIEIRDGFSRDWGFSWGDFGANTIGATYPLLQANIPLLHYITPKISYYPSPGFRAGSNKAIIDDYESTYDWLCLNPRGLLPESLGRHIPAFINIALGHSVKDLDMRGGGHHEWYLSLDWNTEGLPGDGWFWNLLKRNLNFYHLPAPAVRISPGVVWYGLHF
jgi:hypothetical protein